MRYAQEACRAGAEPDQRVKGPHIMDDKFRSRKFIVTLTIIAVGSIALFVGKLTGAEWVTMAGLSIGLYAGSNVAQRAVEK